MRLFAAICLSPAVRASLADTITTLRGQGKGTFTRPENLHLTLAFIGETDRVEAAQAALQYHKSQVVHGWAIQDGGEYDNSLFGLVRTTVGPDEEKNDFFEHIG